MILKLNQVAWAVKFGRGHDLRTNIFVDHAFPELFFVDSAFSTVLVLALLVVALLLVLVLLLVLLLSSLLLFVVVLLVICSF